MNALRIKAGRRHRAATEEEILYAAMRIQLRRLEGTTRLSHPRDMYAYLREAMGPLDHELLMVVYLDTRNRVLKANPMFRGTLDGASVYPREIAKEALAIGAAQVILAHNHPSGIAEPSRSDELITFKIREGLRCFDIRLVDHVVVTQHGCESMAERGLI